MSFFRKKKNPNILEQRGTSTSKLLFHYNLLFLTLVWYTPVHRSQKTDLYCSRLPRGQMLHNPVFYKWYKPWPLKDENQRKNTSLCFLCYVSAQNFIYTFITSRFKPVVIKRLWHHIWIFIEVLNMGRYRFYRCMPKKKKSNMATCKPVLVMSCDSVKIWYLTKLQNNQDHRECIQAQEELISE